MNLYALQPADINDLLELIRTPSLTITANMAPRLVQLQSTLANLAPSTEHEELKAAHLELRAQHDEVCKQADELARIRDRTLLELGLERKRVAELEGKHTPPAMCECGHKVSAHSKEDAGCMNCDCLKHQQ